MELVIYIIGLFFAFALGAAAMYAIDTEKMNKFKIQKEREMKEKRFEEYRSGYNAGVEVGKDMYAISTMLRKYGRLRNRILRRLMRIFDNAAHKLHTMSR